MEVNEPDEKIVHWETGTTLKPTPGCVYKFSGTSDSLKDIVNSDGFSWRDKSSSAKRPRGESSITTKRFTAVPDWKNVPAKVVEESKLSNGEMSLKTVTFKKIVTFDSKDGIFTIKYTGNDKQYPWKEADNLHIKECLEVKDKVDAIHYEDAIEKITEDNCEQVILCGEKNTVSSAKPCLNTCPETKMLDLKGVKNLLELQDRSYLKGKLCDASHKLIVEPKAGDCFLLDMTTLKNWSGNFHNDGCSWKQYHSKHSSEIGLYSQYYHLRKNGKVCAGFAKEMHIHHVNKRIFVHYFGKYDGMMLGKKAFIPTSTFVRVSNNYNFNYKVCQYID